MIGLILLHKTGINTITQEAFSICKPLCVCVIGWILLYKTGCKDHALSCGRPRKIMKGGGTQLGHHGRGTSRHGRHDVGTPELSFKYILQSVSS